ncbi:PaaI family thioesterase [Desulfobacula sp.]|uniref:PaaI family thioesterase n=1 Tax=Desulfobacula sp. TaxID=2593537 RepID=UPI0025C5165C|nr:PaaI family thioesterase [Desulfobacula sp.]MBC2705705.1 PaaI family thioesterase [Desulfobacula sp.]
MTNSDHYIKLENMMHSAQFVQLTGARVSIKKGEAHITLPVRKELYHAAGAMHGALYFLALDNAAFFAANSLVEDVFVLTTSLTTYITRPVSEGVVKSIGKVVNQNHSQFICESVLYDSNDKEIARATGIFVRSKIPLSDKIGYK